MIRGCKASGTGLNVSDCQPLTSHADPLGARSDSSDESMVINGLDLNYLGIYDVWNNDLGTIDLLCHGMTNVTRRESRGPTSWPQPGRQHP